MRPFNDFNKKCKLKNEVTSNRKIKQIHDSTGLDNIGIYLRDGSFWSAIGIVNSNPLKEKHCVVYINENCFNSYGGVFRKKLSKLFIKRNGQFL